MSSISGLRRKQMCAKSIRARPAAWRQFGNRSANRAQILGAVGLVEIQASMNKHTLALISIIGSSLDVLGALYLAYDLLGGEHGPLRPLSRGVTYGVLYGGGYGLVLGPVFGIAAGVAHGITLAWEFSRAS